MCLCCISCHDSGLREWWCFATSGLETKPFVTAALGVQMQGAKKASKRSGREIDSKHQSEQPFRSTRNYKRPVNGSRLLFRNYILHGAETGIHNNTKCKTTE